MARVLESAVRATLQHPDQARILQACIGRARAAKDIADEAGVPIVSCYRHLHALQESGLVRVERSAMTKTGRPYDLYQSTLSWAGLRVSRTGIRAEWALRADMGDRLFGLWSQMEDRQ